MHDVDAVGFRLVSRDARDKRRRAHSDAGCAAPGTDTDQATETVSCPNARGDKVSVHVDVKGGGDVDRDGGAGVDKRICDVAAAAFTVGGGGGGRRT